MMHNLLAHIDVASKNFLRTLKRFPLVSFSAFLLTLFLVIFLNPHPQPMESYLHYNIATKIALVMTLAIPLFIVARLISPRMILNLVAVVLLVGYYFSLPDTLENPHILIKHLLLMLAFSLFVFPAPFLSRPIKNAKFWEWTQQVMIALLSSLLFGFFIYLGLLGMVYAFEQLFNVNVGSDFNIQLALVVFGLFGVNYFLSQIPQYPRLVLARPYTKLENIFSKYILTLFFLAYFLILYLYTFKIIFFSEFPSGELAWLILIFSAIAIVTLFFWTPLWGTRNNKFTKAMGVALLIQTLMLGLSIYLRIDQYGMTENRYYILVAGIWLFFISLYFIFFKNVLYKWIFISISLTILLTQVGPLSAQNMTQWGQERQLQKLLENNPNLSNESNLTLRHQISNSIDYLYYTYGIESLAPVLPNIVEEFTAQESNSSEERNPANFNEFATRRLGFDYIGDWEWEELTLRKELEQPISIQRDPSKKRSLNVKGYEWVEPFQYDNYEKQEFGYDSEETSSTDEHFDVQIEEAIITVRENAKTIAKIDLSEFFETLKKREKERNAESPPRSEDQLTYLYKRNGVTIKVILNAIEYGSEKRLLHHEGILLIHQK